MAAHNMAAVPAVLQSGFDPIEQVFSKLKTLLRKASERAVEANWKRVGAPLDEFTPNECAHYLAKSGYAYT